MINPHIKIYIRLDSGNYPSSTHDKTQLSTAFHSLLSPGTSHCIGTINPVLLHLFPNASSISFLYLSLGGKISHTSLPTVTLLPLFPPWNTTKLTPAHPGPGLKSQDVRCPYPEVLAISPRTLRSLFFPSFLLHLISHPL